MILFLSNTFLLHVINQKKNIIIHYHFIKIVYHKWRCKFYEIVLVFLEINHLKLSLSLSFLLYMTQTFHFLLKYNSKNHLLKIYWIFECIKKQAWTKGCHRPFCRLWVPNFRKEFRGNEDCFLTVWCSFFYSSSYDHQPLAGTTTIHFHPLANGS